MNLYSYGEALSWNNTDFLLVLLYKFIIIKSIMTMIHHMILSMFSHQQFLYVFLYNYNMSKKWKIWWKTNPTFWWKNRKNQKKLWQKIYTSFKIFTQYQMSKTLLNFKPNSNCFCNQKYVFVISVYLQLIKSIVRRIRLWNWHIIAIKISERDEYKMTFLHCCIPLTVV